MNRTTTSSWDEILNKQYPFGDYSEQFDKLEKNINNSPFILPIAKKVAAQTIGLDLVPVQPMSGPSLDLLYVDYKYNDTPEPEVKIEDSSIMGRITKFQENLLISVYSFFSSFLVSSIQN